MRRGFTLPELLIALVGFLILAVFVGQLFTTSQKASQQDSNSSFAQSERDGLILQLQKDFDRHYSASDGVELAPTGAPFSTAPALPCSNLTIRQSTGVSGVTKKIEYKTECNGIPFASPADNKSELHSELANCPDATAPTLTITVWDDQAVTLATRTTVYPRGNIRAVLICFRPNALVNPTQFTAEVSIAYLYTSTIWKVLKRNITLRLNDLGSGVEIIPAN